PEADQLVRLLTNLRSRFAPIPLTSPNDLKKYGLGGEPLRLRVRAGGKDYDFALAERADASNHFSAPTYLRLGDQNEVIRLAPHLVAELDRPESYYRQRRLFPTERVAREPGSPEKAEQLAARAVSVTGPEGGFRLSKTADGWELRDLVRDKIDPKRVK